MKIRLLKDIVDTYWGIKYNAGDIVLAKVGYGVSSETSAWQVVEILWYGKYLYAKEGEWERID